MKNFTTSKSSDLRIPVSLQAGRLSFGHALKSQIGKRLPGIGGRDQRQLQTFFSHAMIVSWDAIHQNQQYPTFSQPKG